MATIPQQGAQDGQNTPPTSRAYFSMHLQGITCIERPQGIPERITQQSYTDRPCGRT